MKASHYKAIGIILLMGALVASLIVQFLGAGLITTRPPGPPVIVHYSHGHTGTMTESAIVFHTIRLLVLSSLALLGCASLLHAKKKSRG